MPRKKTNGASPDMKMVDIAHLAGVSKSTVSRALADSNLVSEQTKVKIRQIAQDHNYQINTAASQLRQQRTGTVKVLVPLSAAGAPMFADPFVMDLIASIADSLSDRDFNLLLSKVALAAPDLMRERFDARNVEGVIVVGQQRFHNELNAMAETNAPLVVWGARFDDQNYCSVGGDNIGGARSATRHLINLGRKRIVFFGDVTMVEPKLRYDGYCKELERAGIPFRSELIVSTQYDRLSAYDAMRRCIESGLEFDAVFGTSDVLAMRAIAALHDHGIEVPGQVSVVGYDDVTLASCFSPSLTTVRQNIRQSGAILVDKVLAMAAGETVSSDTLPQELVVRRSCGAVT